MNKRPNILYICPDESLGGSTRSLLNLILSIKDKIQPIVLLPSPNVAYDEFRRNDIETIVHPFIKLYQRYSWKNVLLHPWRVFLIRFLRQDIACARYVKKYLDGRKIDIVHSNYSPIYTGYVLAKILKAKHICHVREFIDLDFNYNIYGGIPLLRWFINNADARVAITTAIKKHWQMPIQNTWVINNAILRKEEACYIPEKEKYILYSAYNMTERKGARTAIVAFAQSGMSKNGYILKLVGNCHEEYKSSLLQTLREYGMVNSVEFVPCQKDVKPFFSHATAYLMTSEFEALGRVTAEAMFYGCPVIAHATGGTLDLVKDGETGYLYDTIDDCANLIQKVCAESQERLILQAQDFAINNLSQEIYGPKIMNVYNKVLNN